MVKILTVTGTKGKTTTVRLLDFVLEELKYNILRVDTDGHYVNDRKKSDYTESRKYWGMVPNNCPGRFLYELKNMPEKNTLAVLEAAIGSSSLFGMGYAFHDIGLITNIYDDHITKVRIKNRGDIYKAKSFIFQRVKRNGTFIFNSDDKFLTKRLVKEKIAQDKIAVGRDISEFSKKTFFKKGNSFIKLGEEAISLVRGKREKEIIRYKDAPITFDGEFEPNIYNLGFVIAALVAFLGSKRFESKMNSIKRAIKKYEPTKKGGRLVFLSDKKKKIRVIIDFAHEKESFKQIARLARKYSKNKVIGVLRTDPSRINRDILKTARHISKFYDFIYIYDKVDGVVMKKSKCKAEGKIRRTGETAKVFAEGLKKNGYNNFKIVLQEQKAFREAYKNSKQGDVVVYIGSGYSHEKTFKFTKSVIK